MSKKPTVIIPVDHVAKLANLNLSGGALAKHQEALNAVLTHVQELQRLDLSAVPLTSRVIEEENILREDVVESSLTQESALQNAPQTYQGYFVVKAIFEDKET